MRWVEIVEARVPGAGGRRPFRATAPMDPNNRFLMVLRRELDGPDGDSLVPHKVEEIWAETIRQIMDQTDCSPEEARNVLEERTAGILSVDILRSRRFFYDTLAESVTRGLREWMNFGYSLKGWVYEVNANIQARREWENEE